LKQEIDRCKTARSQVKGAYDGQSLEKMPLETLELQWREAGTKVWPLKSLAQRKVEKLLRSYSSNQQANPQSDIPALQDLLVARRNIQASPLSVLSTFSGEQTDLDSVS